MSAREAFSGSRDVLAWPDGSIAEAVRHLHFCIDGSVHRYFPHLRLIARDGHGHGERHGTVVINEMPGNGCLEDFNDFAARLALAIRRELARDERRSRR